jgi:hypothetical protein
MLAVGAVAAAASWAHVVSLARLHGQAGWLAVADAAVIETAAVSAGLEVRRRRQAGQSAVFVLVVLVVAVVLSLAAQVAEAERSIWGWTLAAIPAAGFLVLVKIALREGAEHGEDERDAGHARTVGAAGDPAGGGHPHGRRAGAGRGDAAAGGAHVVQPVDPARDAVAGDGDQADPRAAGAAGRDRRPGEAGGHPGRDARVAGGERGTGPGDPGHAVVAPDELLTGPLADLLPVGQAVRADLQRAGQPVNRASLARAVRATGQSISTQRAADLLAALRDAEPATTPERPPPP